MRGATDGRAVAATGRPAGADSPFAVRRLPPAAVGLALGVAIAFAAFANFVLFRSEILIGFLEESHGWLSGTLVANLALLVIVVGGCLCVVGRARPRDLGMRLRALPAAIGVTAAIWLLLHATAALAIVVDGGKLGWSVMAQRAPRTLVTELAGQVFGNALFEEILFRGCLLVQAVLWFARNETSPTRSAVWSGLLSSQAVFALQHVSNRLANDAWPDAATAASDLGMLFVHGLFFAGLFLRTRNLFVAVGVHALGNCPTLLVAAPDWVHPVVLFVATLTLLALGPRCWRAGGQRAA